MKLNCNHTIKGLRACHIAHDQKEKWIVEEEMVGIKEYSVIMNEVRLCELCRKSLLPLRLHKGEE